MKDIKVTFSDTPIDFSGWVKEKCGLVLLNLCAVVRAQPEIIKNDDFQDALDNALKLYALANGNLNGIRCEKVYSLLTRFNVEGYYFLDDILHKTKKSSIMRKIFQSECDEKILELIEENNKLNRTKLAELLAKSDCKNNWISEVSEDLENLHNGIRTWDWFYRKHSNDRNTFKPQFNDNFIREIFEYFQSDAYYATDDFH